MNDMPLYIQKLDRINETIIGIYDDAVARTPRIYLNFLREIQKIIYFDFGNIVFFWKNQGVYDLESFCQIGWEQDIVESYTSHYYREDDVFPIFATKTPVVMRSSDMFDASRTFSEYYKDFMETAGFDRSLECNIILPQDMNCYGICSLFRKLPKQDFTLEEKRVLEVLQPHLSNGSKLVRDKGNRPGENGNASFRLSGTVAFRKDGTILEVDEDYKRILYEHMPGLNQQSLIKDMLRYLEGAMERAASNSLGRAYYKIPDLPILAEITEEEDGETPAFLCRVYDISGIMGVCLEQARVKHQLSEREFEVLLAILKGMEREEIAKMMLVSIPTVKKHISSVYKKLNVESQKQLIGKLVFHDLPE